MISTIDPIDRNILAALQSSGRASFQDIGQSVGLSVSACHKRVKRMERDGIIERYAAILSEVKAGYTSNAYVWVTLVDQKQSTLGAFEVEVVQHPQVMECVLLSGDSDYLLRILCDGVSGYEQLHNGFLSCLPGVERLRSSFSLRTVCRRTSIPIKTEQTF